MGRYSTKLPFWNTGRVYATTSSVYMASPYGLICTGNRDYTVGEEFASLVCRDNGFDTVDFFGHQDGYIEFMENNRNTFGNETVDYITDVYKENSILPEFLIGGAKCDSDAANLNRCDIIDYTRTGGNCLAKSALFVHCSGYQNRMDLKPGVIYAAEERTCRTCGSEPNFVNQVCGARGRNSENRPLVESSRNNRLCAGECFVKITYCEPCEDYDDSYSYYMEDEDYYDEYSYETNEKPKIVRKLDDGCSGLPDAIHDFKRYCPDELSLEMKSKLCDGKTPDRADLPDLGELSQASIFSVDNLPSLIIMSFAVFFVVFIIIKWRQLRRTAKYTKQQKEGVPVKRSETSRSEYDRTKHTEERTLLSSSVP